MLQLRLNISYQELNQEPDQLEISNQVSLH